MSKLKIEFSFNGNQYSQIIDTDVVDEFQYENIWCWWFGDNKYDFELTCNKGNDGEIKVINPYINVYETDEQHYFTQITDIKHQTITD